MRPDMLGDALAVDWPGLIVSTIIIFAAAAGAVWLGARPLMGIIARQERMFDEVLRHKLLLDIPPRVATVLSFIGIALMALLGYSLTGSWLGGLVAGAIGAVFPALVMRVLKARRLSRLEGQLVDGIQTLTSSVRAGLNLVQAFELVSTDGPAPLNQEFAHLLREYEYGVPLDEAMANAAARIDSGDFRLLFSALQTHRERGGDLGETLDRIAESIREIQRLENRVKTLTAQGRATARWLGAMPIAVLAILYLLVDPAGVRRLFIDDIGKLVLTGIVVLNIVGFLWIKKIVSIDV